MAKQRPPNPFSAPGPLSAAARSGGSSALGAASADYLKELKLNTQTLDRLAKLAATPAGSALAQRAYASSLDSSAARARAEAETAGSATAYLGTAGGANKYAEAGRQEDRASAAQARLQQRQAELEGRRQQTPEYQRATQERVGAQAAESLNALRARVLGQQASAERAATPQGQAEFGQRRELEQQGRDAKIRQSQAENVAAYGQLGGAVQNTWQKFQRGAAAIEPFARAAGVAAVAFNSAVATVYGFIQAASPSAVSTFNNSLSLASATIGKDFIPVLDQASRWAQDFAASRAANRQEGLPKHDLEGAWRIFAGYGPLALLQAGWTGVSPQERYAAADKKLARDIDPRLQSKTYGSFAEYGKDIQTSGLNAGNQQAANKLLEEQLRVLTEQGQLLRDLKDNTDSLRNFRPLFA